ncbi:MAG TPA: tRNA (adenosine(37)-N6)-dimethylallyltransferase MiaA [Acidimicrobiales bacterium]|nr:tRNA (adenosine(37)-N6)-dimethylallyltransferase MiaA [Acidimicrobiales bacterium]
MNDTTADHEQGPRHLALVGCTASGKSAIAVELARRLGDIEIVTVDSMQVYRGMDIGTAKPTPQERSEIPHHLIDIGDPSEDWNVTRWAAIARRTVDEIERRGHRVLLVGGTGLYFQALVDGFSPPGRFPEIRKELEEDQDTSALHSRLRELDPLAASRMEPTNRRRVIRALEVTIGSGRSFSSYGPGVAHFPSAPRWRIAGVWLPRPVLARRIDERLDAMMQGGFLDEVRRLVAATVESGLSRTARQALGYRELLGHLQDGIPLEQAVDEAKRRTRAFARRQRVWWRRDPRIAWFGAPDNPFAVTAALLGQWKSP